MQVKSYTFQSPYPNQVQIGRADSSSTQNEKTTEDTSKLNKQSNETLKSAETFTNTQTQEVEPQVKSERMLDVYA
jgi:hypothetical protein